MNDHLKMGVAIRGSAKKGTHFLAWYLKALMDKACRGCNGFKNANLKVL